MGFGANGIAHRLQQPGVSGLRSGDDAHDTILMLSRCTRRGTCTSISTLDYHGRLADGLVWGLRELLAQLRQDT